MSHVLVTGGAGFMGSALVRELLAAGEEVWVYDSFISGHRSLLEGLEKDVHIVSGDILSWKFFRTLDKNDIEYVYHLAAEPYIPHSYDNPEQFIETNIRGSMNVLFACKSAGVKRILHVSTSEVYGTAKFVPINEDHPTLPLSTYAVSKLAADRLCYVLHHEHGIPVIIARPFNSYGPRETQPYVIPEMVSQLTKGNRVQLGNIKAKRDFTYVHDTSKALISLMKSSISNGEVVNVGSNKSYSIGDLANLIGELCGHQRIEIVQDKSRLRPLDVEVLQCDSTKLQQQTGWKPTVDIRKGLELTIEWFRSNNHRWPWEGVIEGQYDSEN